MYVTDLGYFICLGNVAMGIRPFWVHGEWFCTSFDSFTAYCQRFGVMTSGHLCIACMTRTLAWSCRSLIHFSALPFWWCAFTMQYGIFVVVGSWFLLWKCCQRMSLCLHNSFFNRTMRFGKLSNAVLDFMSSALIWSLCMYTQRRDQHWQLLLSTLSVWDFLSSG